MPFNTGTVRELVELYAGKGGVNRDRVPPELVYRVINFKLQEWARKTGTLSSKITRATEASKQEYELGQGVIHITKVNYDGNIAHKIAFEDVDQLRRKIS